MELLETSVKRRLRSDVPVGTSLSGGLDSSTIVGIVSNTKKNKHTFSARFPGFSKDEGKYIDIVSSLFETNHHNIVVNEDELLPELDKLIYHQEEPFQTVKSIEKGSRLHGIYEKTLAALSDPKHQQNIIEEFPKPSIHRRNTGYAVDMLLHTNAFELTDAPFNFCSLISGSEGTLCFATRIKLHVDVLPPAHLGLVCGHFNTIDEALRANLIALQFNPSASELMDH
jgi:hypothetical protein